MHAAGSDLRHGSAHNGVGGLRRLARVPAEWSVQSDRARPLRGLESRNRSFYEDPRRIHSRKPTGDAASIFTDHNLCPYYSTDLERRL